MIAPFLCTTRRCFVTLKGSHSGVSAAKLREIGIGYGSQEIKECVIKAIQARSSLDVLMTDLDVLLCDVHDTEIPDTLLQRQVNSLTMFETSQQYAQKMKTFASSRSPRKGNSVAAYRSSLHNLLNRAECSTLIKLLEEKRCITRKPHIIRKEDSTDEGEHKARGPIIVSTLPALSQQNALIDSLRGSLLGHVCCGNASTIYQLGDTTLITFLPVGLFAQVICSAPNYANRLEFMTRKQKHSSAVLNALFKLDVLNEGDGFSADDFLPAIPEKTSKTSRGTRLHEVGIQGDLMYGLSIAPKSSVRIGNIPILSHAQDGEKDTLLKFVFWMDETAKLKKKDKLGEVLRSWFPNVDPLTACDAGALGANDFATLFGAALPMFKEGKCSHAFLRGFKAFCSCYEVEKRTEEFFD